MSFARVRPPEEHRDQHPTALDQEIVDRVLGGDRDAYALLVQRYQDGLFRFALGMVGSYDAAADLVQESLVKGFTDLSRCRDASRFGAWLTRIVRNRCLDYLKDLRRSHLPLNDELFFGTEHPGADDGAERSEVLRALTAALQDLPEGQREAFLLKHVEDRSYQEMAELLDASESALKMRVKRAREALQLVLTRSLRL
jgi:RNA polymerase sigma-70 factor, ECF subfamily